MNTPSLEYVLEALRGCWAEIESMQNTYEDYVASGHLEEQVASAVTMLEEAIDSDS